MKLQKILLAFFSWLCGASGRGTLYMLAPGFGGAILAHRVITVKAESMVFLSQSTPKPAYPLRDCFIADSSASHGRRRHSQSVRKCIRAVAHTDDGQRLFRQSHRRCYKVEKLKSEIWFAKWTSPKLTADGGDGVGVTTYSGYGEQPDD